MDSVHDDDQNQHQSKYSIIFCWFETIVIKAKKLLICFPNVLMMPIKIN